MELTQYFHETRVLNETGRMHESASPDWWLSSGGLFIQQNGIGKTIQGALPQGSIWQMRYAGRDDTDHGLHPQNVFRLVSRSCTQDCTQQMRFRINNYRASPIVRRNASNGVFFLARYQDPHNLYYVGLRVDGYAVIKKKSSGVHETLAKEKVFPGDYDRENKPCVLPLHTWLGMRCEVRNRDGGVDILLLLEEKARKWRIIAQAHDDKPFSEGHGGIKSEFMDAEFENYNVQVR